VYVAFVIDIWKADPPINGRSVIVSLWGSHASHRSILVVDDPQRSLEMIAEYLSFIGFAVSTASDAVAALARAEQLRPDVVLMDLALPGAMDGWEATRRIKASQPSISNLQSSRVCFRPSNPPV